MTHAVTQTSRSSNRDFNNVRPRYAPHAPLMPSFLSTSWRKSGSRVYHLAFYIVSVLLRSDIHSPTFASDVPPCSSSAQPTSSPYRLSILTSAYSRQTLFDLKICDELALVNPLLRGTTQNSRPTYDEDRSRQSTYNADRP